MRFVACALFLSACSGYAFGGLFDGGPPSDDAMISDGTASSLCVTKINEYRATLSLPPLAHWTDGDDCAAGQAKADGDLGQGHHSFGNCGEFAQNECVNWPSQPSSMIGPCLQQMWNEGPGGGHYENMRSANATKVSCGFALTKNGYYWATQNFR